MSLVGDFLGHGSGFSLCPGSGTGIPSGSSSIPDAHGAYHLSAVFLATSRSPEYPLPRFKIPSPWSCPTCPVPACMPVSCATCCRVLYDVGWIMQCILVVYCSVVSVISLPCLSNLALVGALQSMFSERSAVPSPTVS